MDLSRIVMKTITYPKQKKMSFFTYEISKHLLEEFNC